MTAQHFGNESNSVCELDSGNLWIAVECPRRGRNCSGSVISRSWRNSRGSPLLDGDELALAFTTPNASDMSLRRSRLKRGNLGLKLRSSRMRRPSRSAAKPRATSAFEPSGGRAPPTRTTSRIWGSIVDHVVDAMCRRGRVAQEAGSKAMRLHTGSGRHSIISTESPGKIVKWGWFSNSFAAASCDSACTTT